MYVDWIQQGTKSDCDGSPSDPSKCIQSPTSYSVSLTDHLFLRPSLSPKFIKRVVVVSGLPETSGDDDYSLGEPE